MHYQEIEVSKLKPADYNPRIMGNDEFEQLKRSITVNGMPDPVIINKDFTIISGHQRVKAANDLGWLKVPCITVDVNKRQEKQMNISFNKIGGIFDEDRLADLVVELGNEAIGFSAEEIAQFLEIRKINIENETYNPEEDEDIKNLFARNERVKVGLKEPLALKENGIGFYTNTFEEYDTLRNFFKTKAIGELDLEKLLNLIK